MLGKKVCCFFLLFFFSPCFDRIRSRKGILSFDAGDDVDAREGPRGDTGGVQARIKSWRK